MITYWNNSRSRQRNWLGHIMRGDSLVSSKNYNRGKNGREKEKRKTENNVTGLDVNEDHSKL